MSDRELNTFGNTVEYRKPSTIVHIGVFLSVHLHGLSRLRILSVTSRPDTRLCRDTDPTSFSGGS